MIKEKLYEYVFSNIKYDDALVLAKVRIAQKAMGLLRGVRLQSPVRSNRTLLRELARTMMRNPMLMRHILPVIDFDGEIEAEAMHRAVAILSGARFELHAPEELEKGGAKSPPEGLDAADEAEEADQADQADEADGSEDAAGSAGRELPRSLEDVPDDVRRTAFLTAALVPLSERDPKGELTKSERTLIRMTLLFYGISDSFGEGDRLTRFGFRFLKVMRDVHGIPIEEIAGRPDLFKGCPEPSADPMDDCRGGCVEVGAEADDAAARGLSREEGRDGGVDKDGAEAVPAAGEPGSSDASCAGDEVHDANERAAGPASRASQAFQASQESQTLQAPQASADAADFAQGEAAPESVAEVAQRPGSQDNPNNPGVWKTPAVSPVRVEPAARTASGKADRAERSERAVRLCEAAAPAADRGDSVERIPDPEPGVTRWLGYIRKSGSFRNFFPVARWEPPVRSLRGGFRPISPREAQAHFPRLGAINLRGFRSALSDGTLLVIDLEPSDIRPNQGLSGGVREDFECLVDWPELSAKGAVRLAADYRIWLLVYPEDDRALAAAQAEPRARTVRVRFSNSPAAREARSMGLSGLPALLCAGGRHMGPFTLREDASHASYVTLASRTGDGLAPGFSASGAQPRRFSMMSRAGKDDWTERELTWVDDSRQAPQCFDLLTDEELLAHLAEAAPGFGATDAESPRGVERALERLAAGRAAESLFPANETIRAERVRRLARILESQSFAESACADVARILRAAVTERDVMRPPLFEAVARRYAEDPKLLEAVSGHAEVARRIREDEERARALAEKVSGLEAEARARRAEIEEELAGERRRMREETARLKSESQALGREIAERSKGLEDLIASAGVSTLRERLERDVAALEARNGALREQARGIEADLARAGESVRRTLVDGAVAAKLQDAAAAWRSGEDDARALAEARAFARVRPTALSGAMLRDRLVSAVLAERDYSENDAANLFLTLSQNFLTVFAGPPGSGKTSACAIIARALGLTGIRPETGEADEHGAPLRERFLPIAVERGWTSRRDLLGWRNPMTGRFEAEDAARREAFLMLDAETRLGGEASGLPFLALLDEANLSPMEHYWADFMNAGDLEDGPASPSASADGGAFSGAFRGVALGDGTLRRFPAGLRFLATINSDRTTEALSPRLIDRAAVVTLPEPTPATMTEPAVMTDFFGTARAGRINAAAEPLDGPVPMARLQALFSSDGRTVIPADPLNAMARRMLDAGAPLSMRRRLAVARHLRGASKAFTRDDAMGQSAAEAALDFAALEHLLPCIAGTGEEARSLLESLLAIAQDAQLVRSAAALRRMLRTGDAAMGCYGFFA